jgi:hypothetical protein
MAYYSAYMMYSRHSSLAQLFGDDSDGFRSGLADDGSDMEICGGVRGWPYSVTEVAITVTISS